MSSAAELDRLHARIAGRFARAEPRRRARQYMSGLVAGLDRTNALTVAQRAGDVSPDGMQRLLRRADWDAGLVRDDVRDYVIEHLGGPGGVLIAGDTGFPKKGVKSAGVARQRCGSAGPIENCQVGVFLAYRSDRGCALIDRRLYLPAEWTGDRDRCRAAGIGDDVRFATEARIAGRMLARAFAAGVRPAWVTMGGACGRSRSLRRWLETNDQAYVAEVPGGDGAGFPHWSESSGPYAWACAPRPGGRHWLLARRTVSTGELAHYACFGPPGAGPADLVRAAGRIGELEDCLRLAKERAGLGHYQVRDWRAWHAHITLSMAALAAVVAATPAR